MQSVPPLQYIIYLLDSKDLFMTFFVSLNSRLLEGKLGPAEMHKNIPKLHDFALFFTKA